MAVNNHGAVGRWRYVEITSMNGVRSRLGDAIDLLYTDAPIAGDPDLLDEIKPTYAGRHRAC